MATLYFPAIIEAGEEGFGVFFPDLPGCVSAGATQQEAARMAEEALGAHLALMVESKEMVPNASPLDKIKRDPDVKEVARILVRADLPGQLARVNITMDEGLLKRVDSAAEDLGFTRSGFLAEAARRYFQGMRRDAAEGVTSASREKETILRDGKTGALRSGEPGRKLRRPKHSDRKLDFEEDPVRQLRRPKHSDRGFGFAEELVRKLRPKRHR
jgi:predicted RNase H-like HicB family nuclease